jgi:hypothetical protein
MTRQEYSVLKETITSVNGPMLIGFFRLTCISPRCKIKVSPDRQRPAYIH